MASSSKVAPATREVRVSMEVDSAKVVKGLRLPGGRAADAQASTLPHEPSGCQRLVGKTAALAIALIQPFGGARWGLIGQEHPQDLLNIRGDLQEATVFVAEEALAH